jgi:hypothetical protein
MNKIYKIDKFQFENRANFDATDAIQEYFDPTTFGTDFFITISHHHPLSRFRDIII